MAFVAEKKRQPPQPQKGPRTPAGPPAARGHRFGPSLTCAFCGISYGVHHREPRPCPHEPVPTERSPGAPPETPVTPS